MTEKNDPKTDVSATSTAETAAHDALDTTDISASAAPAAKDDKVTIYEPAGPESRTIPISRESVKASLQETVESAAAEGPEPEDTEAAQRRQVKIFCHGCSQKLDVTELNPFSRFDCPECGAAIIVPKWFDTYLLEEPGGVGGMATVYRALDVALDREVAIKILNPNVADDAARAKLFLHEARTAATINHPSIIPIYTCGEFEEQPYLVMQFMKGGALDKLIDNAKAPIESARAIAWLRDVADGLDNARRHGIIHHDIKPGNILLDDDGMAKIGDFGIAQAIFDEGSREVEGIVGSYLSPHYVSPEKALTGKEDYRGDIYSLGATFYHILALKPPYDNPDTRALVKERLLKDPPQPSAVQPGIPEEISNLIIGMMVKDPAERPSYERIKTVCDDYLKNEREKRKRTGKRNEAAPPRAGASATPARAISAPRRPRSGATGRAPVTVVPRKTSKRGALIGHLIIWLILIGAGVGVWKSGLLSGRSDRELPDLLPSATQEFRTGRVAGATGVAALALDHPELDAAVKKQAAVQFAIGQYLSNAKDAREKAEWARSKLEQAGVPPNDPLMTILYYLSSADAPSEALLKQLGENNKPMAQLATLTAAVRELYEDRSRVDWMTEMLDYSSNLDVPGTHWVNAWRGRVDYWYDWNVLGKGNELELEPLIAKIKAERFPVPKRVRTYAMTAAKQTPPPKTIAKVTKKKRGEKTETAAAPQPEAQSETPEKAPELSLNDLTADALKRARAFASARPRPASYWFNDDEVSRYLETLSDKNRAMEEERIGFMRDFMGALTRVVSSEQGKIKLKNGESIEVRMASPRSILARTGKGKERKVSWTEINPEELIKYTDAYATKLVGMGEYAQGREFKRDGSTCFLALAVFCDWYGKYGDAVKYAKKAVSLFPESQSAVTQLFMK